MKKLFLLIALVATTLSSFSQVKKPAPVAKPGAKQTPSKFGALAIDRTNGFYYGWSRSPPHEDFARKIFNLNKSFYLSTNEF